MGWATELHLVSLLQKYLTPHPRVTALVRTQLITMDHKDAITEALRRVTNLCHVIDTPYDAFLNHTCLDWHDEELVAQVSPDLPSAMFDLMLGERVRRLLLNRYSDVHVVRACIEAFIDIWVDDLHPHSMGVELWWDGVSADVAPHQPWIFRGLREDRDFERLLESWADDNMHLQDWLRRFERATTLANNYGQEGNSVFSEETAISIMGFAKVRFLSTRLRRRLIHFRPRENCLTTGEGQSSQKSRSGSKRNANSSVCFRPGCLDSPSYSSTTSPSRK
jgi:hypothetical protein